MDHSRYRPIFATVITMVFQFTLDCGSRLPTKRGRQSENYI
jgi:hypothetical protein